MNTHKGFLVSALVLIACAVALGAFGAHALQNVMSPANLDTFETAVRYQMYHGIGLLIVSLNKQAFNEKHWRIGQWFLNAGTLGFCVSLYVYLATQLTWLVFVTPLGGSALILGWLWLIVGAVKGAKH